MQIKFEKDENQWNSNGTHICDSRGIVVTYTEQTIVTFDSQEICDKVLAIVGPEKAYTTPVSNNGEN